MRICLVYPGLMSGWASYREHGNNETSYINHGLAMISAYLKRMGHETFLIDLRMLQNWSDFEKTLRQPYDFSMITFLSCDSFHAQEAVNHMKAVNPDKLIIAGGIHLSVTQTRQMANVDTIVLGEAESHLDEIVDCIVKGGKPQPVYELKPVEDLDTLPFIDRTLWNMRAEETTPLLPLLGEPFVTIVAGRGCWGKCTFCAPSRNLISGNKIRIRSPENFISEIELILKQKGSIGGLMIHDDLLGTKPWLARFVELWKTKLPRIPIWCQLRADTVIRMKEFVPDLAEIGLTWVSLGLESGSKRMLEFLQKGVTPEQNIEACDILHNSQVNIFGNYILGLPTETKEDIDETEKMLARTMPEWHSASTYTSYPGSYLYEWIKTNDYWVPGDAHYCRTRYPYERCIKGVDYDYIRSRANAFGDRYRGPLRNWSKK